ncbi:enamine deaminase RidA (YjgF/YER057c/UK114 family) [Azospirillum agricola]|uniref:Rid family hydrolase n=1 Tax=Azospirillum agricola TaxID=1720247 RepID=UPI001AE6F7A2|nr:Rid family hydrolase [Azospirillum agricola]MBP2232588.1 enamine deaminase RidA (YjgF/YER057c/UK114 family) [Azospirillum agricola]
MAKAIERYELDASSPYRTQFLESVRVPVDGTEFLMLSGLTPPVIDRSVPDDRVQAYGDTETQTRNILKSLKATLERRGYALNDVVRIQGFLVGDARMGGRADFQGFSRAYMEVFGTAETPNIPVRTRVQVAGLVEPGWLVEIEATAAKTG